MSIHNTTGNDKDYVCDICNKKFNRQSNLRDHMMTHSFEKSYSCSTCLKKFSNSSNLRKHQQLHENIKKFKCLDGTCDKKFSQKIHLEKHMMRIHGCDKSVKEPNNVHKPIIISNELIVPANSS